jgi:hypothetical protein
MIVFIPAEAQSDCPTNPAGPTAFMAGSAPDYGHGAPADGGWLGR